MYLSLCRHISTHCLEKDAEVTDCFVLTSSWGWWVQWKHQEVACGGNCQPAAYKDKKQVPMQKSVDNCFLCCRFCCFWNPVSQSRPGSSDCDGTVEKTFLAKETKLAQVLCAPRWFWLSSQLFNSLSLFAPVCLESQPITCGYLEEVII